MLVIPDDLALSLESASYRYAYTMPDIPHSYALRSTWPDKGGFIETVRLMERHGVTENHGYGPRSYLHLNGYTYWRMDPTPERTTLINRVVTHHRGAPKTEWAGHRTCGGPAGRKAKARHFQSLNLDGNVLHIGCGRGALADWRWRDLRPERYWACEPCSFDRRIFSMKHPAYAYAPRVTPCQFEDYWPACRFDRILELRGSASLMPAEPLIEKVRAVLRGGGSARLEYLPEIVESDRHDRAYDPPDDEEWTVRGGFRVLEVGAVGTSTAYREPTESAWSRSGESESLEAGGSGSIAS